MKSEELFDIDRQISQIKRDLEQRQEKVTEWNVPLDRILKVLILFFRASQRKIIIYRRSMPSLT